MKETIVVGEEVSLLPVVGDPSPLLGMQAAQGRS